MPVGIGHRAVAFVIDATLLGATLTAVLGVGFPRGSGSSPDIVLGLFGGSILAMLSYFVLFERTVGGSLGKLVVNLRVVDSTGGTPSWSAVVMRNVTKPVDWFLVFTPFVHRALSIWGEPAQQRLGDRATGTLVVRRGTERDVALLEQHHASRRVVAATALSVILLFAFPGACALALAGATRSVDAQGQAFLRSLQRGDYATAHALSTTAVRESRTPADLQRVVEAGSAQPRSWQVDAWSVSGETATMNGAMTFADERRGTFSIGFVREEGVWRVNSFRWTKAPAER